MYSFLYPELVCRKKIKNRPCREESNEGVNIKERIYFLQMKVKRKSQSEKIPSKKMPKEIFKEKRFITFSAVHFDQQIDNFDRDSYGNVQSSSYILAITIRENVHIGDIFAPVPTIQSNYDWANFVSVEWLSCLSIPHLKNIGSRVPSAFESP